MLRIGGGLVLVAPVERKKKATVVTTDLGAIETGGVGQTWGKEWDVACDI